jgi:8-amino-7-oxononanoate synthase
VGAAGAALALVAAEPERRARLLYQAARLRAGVAALGLETGGDAQIVQLLVGDNARTVALAEALLARGVLAGAIRPPTVPAGTARLRLTPMATHDAGQIERALDAIAGATRAVGMR